MAAPHPRQLSPRGLRRVLGTDSAQNGSHTPSSQEEVAGDPSELMLLGWEGCLRLGISLTAHPKWCWACSPTSRGRTSLTLWPPVPCLRSADFKVLPYMELKLPPSAPQSILLGPGQRQRFQRNVQFPLQPFCLGLPVPLASRGFGTRYPLSVGPFLEHVHPGNETAP